MSYKTIIEDGIDILVVGAGLGGTGAAWEARFWGQNKKIVIAEKANIDRSGAVAQASTARRRRSAPSQHSPRHAVTGRHRSDCAPQGVHLARTSRGALH